MATRTVLSIGLMVLLIDPLYGQGAVGTPGNPPIVMIASDIDKNGELVLVQYKTIFIHPTEKGGGGPQYNERSLSKTALKDVKIYGGDGNEMTAEAARKLIGGKETPILASSWGQRLPLFYRKVFKDDMLLFAFPQEAPKWKAIQSPEMPVRK